MTCLQLQLGCVFYGDDALMRRNMCTQRIKQSGLAGGSTGREVNRMLLEKVVYFYVGLGYIKDKALPSLAEPRHPDTPLQRSSD